MKTIWKILSYVGVFVLGIITLGVYWRSRKHDPSRVLANLDEQEKKHRAERDTQIDEIRTEEQSRVEEIERLAGEKREAAREKTDADFDVLRDDPDGLWDAIARRIPDPGSDPTP